MYILEKKKGLGDSVFHSLFYAKIIILDTDFKNLNKLTIFLKNGCTELFWILVTQIVITEALRHFQQFNNEAVISNLAPVNIAA